MHSAAQAVKEVRNRQNRLWFFTCGFSTLKKAEYSEFKNAKTACFARILTYCAMHALPYLCTPTGVHCCLSSKLFAACQRVEKGFRRVSRTYRLQNGIKTVTMMTSSRDRIFSGGFRICASILSGRPSASCLASAAEFRNDDKSPPRR